MRAGHAQHVLQHADNLLVADKLRARPVVPSAPWRILAFFGLVRLSVQNDRETAVNRRAVDQLVRKPGEMKTMTQPTYTLSPGTKTTLGAAIAVAGAFLVGQAWLLSQLFGIRGDFRDLSKDVSVIRGELAAISRSVDVASSGAVLVIEFDSFLQAFKAANPTVIVPDRLRRR